MQVCPLAGHQGLLQACTSTAGTRDANLPVPLGSPRQPCLSMARVALSPADPQRGGSWKRPALFLRWAVILPLAESSAPWGGLTCCLGSHVSGGTHRAAGAAGVTVPAQLGLGQEAGEPSAL